MRYVGCSTYFAHPTTSRWLDANTYAWWMAWGITLSDTGWISSHEAWNLSFRARSIQPPYLAFHGSADFRHIVTPYFLLEPQRRISWLVWGVRHFKIRRTILLIVASSRKWKLLEGLHIPQQRSHMVQAIVGDQADYNLLRDGSNHRMEYRVINNDARGGVI